MSLPRAIYPSVNSLDDFDPETYFEEYHQYEEYDPTKEYEIEPYVEDYGKGNLIYENCLYEIREFGDRNKVKKYVVPYEILLDEDVKLLVPYCQCQYHQTAWYNPFKLFICPCCVGCIDSISPAQYVINDTKKYMELVNKTYLL